MTLTVVSFMLGSLPVLLLTVKRGCGRLPVMVMLGAWLFVSGFTIGAFGFGLSLAAMSHATLPSERALLWLLGPGFLGCLVAIFVGIAIGLRR